MNQASTKTDHAEVSTTGAAHPEKGCAVPSLLALQAQAALSAWTEQERAALREQAEVLEVETMEQLRERRWLEAAGRRARLALRLREPRRAGGSFTLEWVLVRGPGRTDYIRRAKHLNYPRSAFARALPWEREIALNAERRLGRIRQRLKLLKEAELRLGLALTHCTQPLHEETMDND